MSETWVVNNVRSEDLQRTIRDHERRGWALHSTVSVSGPGLVGVTFTVIFKKEVA